MEEEEMIDVPEENTSAGTALVKATPVAETKPPITAAQAKIEAVAELTHSAYQKASTLQLSAEETAMLQEDFPDEAFKPGAGGKESLIYIEHAFLRDRFIKVFGMGGWAMVPRSRWSEEFKTQKGVPGVRIYVEAMLVVRGCFVAEAVGDMEYYPSNASQNYGDAVEGAETAALRRCAKKFGVGLQAWKKDFCEGWWKRKRQPSKAPPTVAPTPRAKPPEPKADATEEQRKHFVDKLTETRMAEQATQYCIDLGWIMPNEGLVDVPLRYIPTMFSQYERFVKCMQKWAQDGKPVNPYMTSDDVPRGTKPWDKGTKPIEVPREDVDTPGDQDSWRDFPIPYGKHAGVPMGEVEKNTLWGFWKNHEVTTEYKGKPRSKSEIEASQKFRDYLDRAGEYYEFEDNE